VPLVASSSSSNRAPNPRLQRTRSAPLRSPLSRKPLGATRVKNIHKVVVMLLVGLLPRVAFSEDRLTVLALDQESKPLPGVTVLVRCESGWGLLGHCTTSLDGRCNPYPSFPKPGVYQLTATLTGLLPETRSVVVDGRHPRSVITLTLRLPPPARIMVSGGPPVIDTSRPPPPLPRGRALSSIEPTQCLE
jgi:hypothetical protein